jgi:D-arabinose 1-dehydrogenase-like Zn-dependent alcohol dehydrogenase
MGRSEYDPCAKDQRPWNAGRKVGATGVCPQIETMPLEKAFEAYQRVKSGDVKFRMVLTM